MSIFYSSSQVRLFAVHVHPRTHCQFRLRRLTRLKHVHSTVLALCADTPLVHGQQTPLEVNHAAFLLGIAHQADLTMSLRLLDSGVARDVSGVLRVTVGEQAEAQEDGDGRRWEDREVLYFVGGDGGVKVFERGS